MVISKIFKVNQLKEEKTVKKFNSNSAWFHVLKLLLCSVANFEIPISHGMGTFWVNRFTKSEETYDDDAERREEND